jgi:hypothetical protein
LFVTPHQFTNYSNEGEIEYIIRKEKIYNKLTNGRKSKQQINMKTISRNNPCPCNSGKKFKRCCEKRYSEMNDLSFKRNIIGDIKKREFEESKVHIWRKSIKNLPQRVKTVLREYLNKEQIIEYGCYYNSSHLTLIDSEIKTVRGWYGFKIDEQYIKHIVRGSNKRFFSYCDDFGIEIIDTKKQMKYNPHSWNEYNGIHFDLTTEKNETFNQWITYSICDIKDYKEIKSDSIISDFYLKELKNTKIGLMRGNRILNKNLLELL